MRQDRDINLHSVRLHPSLLSFHYPPSISPLPCQFLPHSISIFHHSTSHGSISLTFNFSHHPITLCPFLTLICLPLYISQPPLSLPLTFPHPPHLSLSHLPCHPSPFLSLLRLHVGFSFPLSLSMSPLLSRASSPIT